MCLGICVINVELIPSRSICIFMCNFFFMYLVFFVINLELNATWSICILFVFVFYHRISMCLCISICNKSEVDDTQGIPENPFSPKFDQRSAPPHLISIQSSVRLPPGINSVVKGGRPLQSNAYTICAHSARTYRCSALALAYTCRTESWEPQWHVQVPTLYCRWWQQGTHPSFHFVL